MTKDTARKNLIVAAQLLETLRPQVSIVMNESTSATSYSDNEPIRKSWSIAIDQYRRACADWNDTQAE